MFDAVSHVRGLDILKLSESFILPTCNFVQCVPVQVGCVWMRMCDGVSEWNTCWSFLYEHYIQCEGILRITNSFFTSCIGTWEIIRRIFFRITCTLYCILEINFRNSLNVDFAGRLDSEIFSWGVLERVYFVHAHIKEKMNFPFPHVCASNRQMDKNHCGRIVHVLTL